ncbi:immunogenic protein MPT64 precursor [Mycobacterium sp. MFM001]|uniref:esterase n=1 Tax=Mycobacterium sp. MFM001 TaxID=2049453 RepID=UPI000DA45706|nr:esterase [Mycobacterium sp. MFM001]GBE64917.1 immunogenic protein MPT64 precursor [Mycobacterium sp. MFM001]
MRFVSMAVLVTAAAIFGSSGIAAAAPKDYCAELKGANTGRTCEIQQSDAGYNVDISIPLDYPDQKSVAEYISQTRDGFLNTAKSGAPRDTPYELKIKPTEYNSAIPPRGTQAVVFKVYQNVGSPKTTWKAFNWDQTYRKEITYTAASDDKEHTPLWRVDDPLKTVGPIVQAELQKQQAPPPPPAQPGQPAAATTAPPPALPIAPGALYNPDNYQNFAVVNDGVIFFFDQGALLPDSAGAPQVLVPRSAIDPMLA